MTANLRVYLPLRIDQVRELADSGRLAGPVDGFAVGEDSGTEIEDSEHAALQRAARVALDSDQPVLVAAADVATADLRAGDAASQEPREPRVVATTVTGDVERSRVAALLVGDDVLGAEPVLDDGHPVELSWYDTTELDQLMSLLDAGND